MPLWSRAGVLSAMKRPDEVTRSPEEGAALIERLEQDTWTVDDRRVVVQVLRWYFWLLFALQETKRSLKRLRTLLCGQPAKKHTAPPPGASSVARDTDGGGGRAASAAGVAKAEGDQRPGRSGGHRPGQGRLGAQAYMGAERVVCRHEELAVGERCPVCGLGRLYTVPPGVERRLDGTALLQAGRSEVETRRCAACGQICPASLPESAGTEKDRPRARAVLAVGRYSLGGPSSR